MHFERLSFEPTEEWQVQDPNFTSDDQSVFSGPLALINPQDVRQYIFILSPVSTSALRPLISHSPGSIFPLGRLNIVWRSSYGEPGRLLTSILTRRIPLINHGSPTQHPQHSHPVSAVPPYLKRISAPVPSRPQSPRPQSRPSTPPPHHLQSPSLNAQSQSAQQLTTVLPPAPDFQVHLTLREPLLSCTKVEEPFTLGFTFHVHTTSPDLAARPHLFAIQHVLPSINHSSSTSVPKRNTNVNTGKANESGYSTPRMGLSPTLALPSQHSQGALISPRPTTTQLPEIASPRKTLSVLSSGFSTPTALSSRGTPGIPQSPGAFNYSLARQKLLGLTPRQESTEFYPEGNIGEVTPGGLPAEEEEDAVVYPPPYPLAPDENSSCSSSVVPVGASSFTLPPPVFAALLIPPHPSSSTTPANHTSHPSSSSIDSFDSDMPEKQTQQHMYSSSDFEVTYIPLSAGFHNVGGLRVLYLGEGETTASQEASLQQRALAIQTNRSPHGGKRRAHIMKEYSVVAEILVSN